MSRHLKSVRTFRGRPLVKPKRKMTAPELKLDLACGQNKKEGFTGVDVVQTEAADLVHDLRKPWPWANESVSEVHCSHFIEHLTGDEFIDFMNELHRVLKVGGKATLIAPYYTSVRAIQDPTHRQFIGAEKFLYFNKKWREENKLDHYPIYTDFDFTYAYAFSPDWASRADEARNFAVRHYFNVVADIHVHMEKRKP